MESDDAHIPRSLLQDENWECWKVKSPSTFRADRELHGPVRPESISDGKALRPQRIGPNREVTPGKSKIRAGPFPNIGKRNLAWTTVGDKRLFEPTGVADRANHVQSKVDEIQATPRDETLHHCHEAPVSIAHIIPQTVSLKAHHGSSWALEGRWTTTANCEVASIRLVALATTKKSPQADLQKTRWGPSTKSFSGKDPGFLYRQWFQGLPKRF